MQRSLSGGGFGLSGAGIHDRTTPPRYAAPDVTPCRTASRQARRAQASASSTASSESSAAGRCRSTTVSTTSAMRSKGSAPARNSAPPHRRRRSAPRDKLRPARAAARATYMLRKRCRSTSPNWSVPSRARSQARDRAGPALRIAQSILDRQPHIGHGKLRLERAVHELDEGMDDALAVHYHLHLGPAGPRIARRPR